MEHPISHYNISKTPKKGGLTYISLYSINLRSAFLKVLNDAITRTANENKELPSLIPTSPIPTVSFWVSTDNGAGFTITRDNSKYGWRYQSGTFVPCSYMSGMQLFSTLFTEDDIKFFKDSIYDSCSQKKELLDKIFT